VCGEAFTETGDRKGLGRAWSHIRDALAGKIDGNHRIMGLFGDGGEELVHGPNAGLAIKKGLIRSKKDDYLEEEEREKAKPVKRSSPLKAELRFIRIDLPAELWLLFEMARMRFPKEYGQATFEEWLTDCVIGFYTDHPELGFDVLFANRPEVVEYLREEGNG
jgi:hypothetical protein